MLREMSSLAERCCSITPAVGAETRLAFSMVPSMPFIAAIPRPEASVTAWMWLAISPRNPAMNVIFFDETANMNQIEHRIGLEARAVQAGARNVKSRRSSTVSGAVDASESRIMLRL